MEGNNTSDLPPHGIHTRTTYSRFYKEAYCGDPTWTPPDYDVSSPDFGNYKVLETVWIQGTSGDTCTKTLAKADKYEDMFISSRNRNIEGKQDASGANFVTAMNTSFQSREDNFGDKLLTALKRNFETNAKLLNLLKYQQNILETLKEHTIGHESPKQFMPDGNLVTMLQNKIHPGTQARDKSVDSYPIYSLKTFGDYNNGNTVDKTESICSSANSVISSDNFYRVTPGMHPLVVAAADTSSPCYSFDKSHGMNGRIDDLPVKLSVHPQCSVKLSLDVSGSNEECQESESTLTWFTSKACSSKTSSVSKDLDAVVDACIQLNEDTSGANEECQDYDSTTRFLAPKTFSNSSSSVPKDLSSIFDACVKLNEEKENILEPMVKKNSIASENLHMQYSKAGSSQMYISKPASPCHSSITGDSNVKQAQSMESDMKTSSNVSNVFSSPLPKSLSVRVKGSPLDMISGSLSSSPLRPKKSCTLRFGTESGEELELYTQGSYKTELCNKWESNNFNCPYGKRCQFAHGLEELRIVARHNKYKTELCRMIATGKPCFYGHRCHFQHTIRDRQTLAELSCNTPR